MLAIQADFHTGTGWTTVQSYGPDVTQAAWQLVHFTDRPSRVHGKPASYRVICGSKSLALRVHVKTRRACLMQEPGHDDFPQCWTIEINNA